MSDNTIRSLVKEGTDILEKNKIADAGNDSMEIFSHITGMNRLQYLMKQNEPLNDELKKEFFGLIQRRAGHIPLQHITGKAYFYGLEFEVNKNVLIPRFDTEVLVEKVLKYARPGMNILDMCTGSGCIAVAIKKNVPEAEVMAADISQDALRVAERNAMKNDVRVNFICSNLFDKVSAAEEDGFDIIVSNPPYIRTAVIDELSEEVRLHDPYIALNGYEDGLFFYRQITKEARSYLKNGGILAYEIGHDQAEDVSVIMKEAGFDNIEVVKDLAGLDRAVVARICD